MRSDNAAGMFLVPFSRVCDLLLLQYYEYDDEIIIIIS